MGSEKLIKWNQNNKVEIVQSEGNSVEWTGSAAVLRFACKIKERFLSKNVEQSLAKTSAFCTSVVCSGCFAFCSICRIVS